MVPGMLAVPDGSQHGKVVKENGYFGDVQRTREGNSAERIYRIAAGITITIDEGANAKTDIQYSISNNVGSTVLTFDGKITQYLRYEPFGKPIVVYDDSNSISRFQWSGFTTKQGFTGHEPIYDMDLIHMQGRASWIVSVINGLNQTLCK